MDENTGVDIPRTGDEICYRLKSYRLEKKTVNKPEILFKIILKKVAGKLCTT